MKCREFKKCKKRLTYADMGIIIVKSLKGGQTLKRRCRNGST